MATINYKIHVFEQWLKAEAADVPQRLIPYLKSAWMAGMDQARFGKKATDDYELYMKSPQWRAFRTKYSKSDYPQTCLICGNAKYQLHHLTYKRLGRELLRDVAPLCGECHGALHRSKPKAGGGLKSFIRHLVKMTGHPAGHWRNVMSRWMVFNKGRVAARKTIQRAAGMA